MKGTTVTINLPLSPDVEAKLRRQAEAAGKDLTELVLEAVEEKLSVMDDAGGPNGHHDLTTEQWLTRFRRWIAGHRALPHEADDSREGIYSGRGE